MSIANVDTSIYFRDTCRREFNDEQNIREFAIRGLLSAIQNIYAILFSFAIFCRKRSNV